MALSTPDDLTVVVAGLSGKLGRLIAQSLLDKPGIRINGLTRDPSKAPTEFRNNSRVTLYSNASPTEAESLRSAVKGADIVICTYLGSPEFERDAQIALIDASIAEGVPRYLASDFTADFRKVKHEIMPQKKANRDVDSYLEAREMEGKIKGVHILIGGFLESLFSYGYFWFGPSSEGGIKYWGTGDETWELNSYKTTAAYVAEVAVDIQATGWFAFLSDRKTTKQIEKTLREVYGEETVIPLKQQGSFDQLVRSFEEGFARAPDDTGFDAWKRSAYLINLTSGAVDLNQPLDNSRYPNVKPENLKEWLQRHELGDLAKSAWF